MVPFAVHPKIVELSSVKEFLQQYKIGNQDLIFINQFTYQDFFKEQKIDCHFLFYEDFSKGEPSDEVVTEIMKKVKNLGVNRIIGIGGGSVLDTAKLLCIENAESCDDIFEDRIPLTRSKTLILIPTTCGTGCEMTCVSVIDRPKHKAKMGKRIECNFADEAILIPELLSKIPHQVFAYSAIDALIHAMEIFVNPFSGSFSKVFCKEAIRLNIKNFRIIAQKGPEAKFEVMNEFLLASAYSGIALSNDVCGAVHACAMHFGGEHHIPHGESNYRFLTAVFNTYQELKPNGEMICSLAQMILEELQIQADLTKAFFALEELLDKIIPKKHLREYGVEWEKLPYYVDKVYETQQRLLLANYIKMSKEEFLEIYKKAY